MSVFTDRRTLVLAFGILGNLVSVFVFFAPWPTFRRIIREKSTMGFQCVPYMVALFSAMLWLYYALLEMATLLITINALGCIIQTVYIILYILYSPKESRKQILKLVSLFNVGALCAIFVLSEFGLKEHSLRVQVVGWICVAFSVSVFAAPLTIVFQVARTKSAEFMPVTLSLALTISAVMWFFYGLLVRDLCVAIPNVVGFVLGSIQMVLWWMYRKSKPANDSEEVEKKSPLPIVLGGRDNVIDILVLQNPEPVHPIAICELSSGGGADKDEISSQLKPDDQSKNKMGIGADVDEGRFSGSVAIPKPVNMMHIEGSRLVGCPA